MLQRIGDALKHLFYFFDGTHNGLLKGKIRDQEVCCFVINCKVHFYSFPMHQLIHIGFGELEYMVYRKKWKVVMDPDMV